MNRKAIAFGSLLIIVTLVLASCGATPTPEVVKEIVTEVVEVEKEVTRIVEGTPVVEQIVVTEVVEKEVTTVVEVEKVVTATTPPKSELANTLVAAHSEYAFTFDPTYCNWTDVDRICMVSYEALVNYDPATGELVPWLAEDWEISDDGLTYTFKIREGVKFHDGTDLTASDVKYTVDRLLGLDEGAARHVYPIESSTVVDDYTIEFKLNTPTAPFLIELPSIFIISEEGAMANEVDGDWAQAYLMENDLGSGPYTVTSFVPEQQANFDKFDDYWQGWTGEEPDGVLWLWITESATQRLMLENGELDIAMNPAADDLAEFEANPDYQVLVGDSPILFEVDFRVIHPPLDDIRVRQALAHAIDADYHIEVALAGYGKRAQGPLASVVPYHNDEIEMLEFDMDKAKALLAEAGYPDGGFALKVAYESAQDEKRRALEMVQANWGELGIEVEPMGMDWMAQAAMQQDEASEPDIYLGYQFIAAMDADTALREFFHGDMKGTYDSNAPLWSDPDVDALMDQGLVETDPVKREEIYKQVQQMIFDATPSVWVAEEPYIVVAQNYVDGYYYNPGQHQTLDVYNMRLEGKP